MSRIDTLLGLLLAGFMGTAVAGGPGYLGDLVGQNVSINNTIAGFGTSFADVYSFDIGSVQSEAIASSVKVKLQYDNGGVTVYDISNFAIALQDTNGVQYAFDDVFDGGGMLELSAILAPSALGAPGFYQFVVTGTTSGSAGGIYAGALSAAPIPEPKDRMLLLAGIGLVGLMVERAKRSRLYLAARADRIARLDVHHSVCGPSGPLFLWPCASGSRRVPYAQSAAGMAGSLASVRPNGMRR